MQANNLNSFEFWELKSQLGSGGFGEVHLWKNRQTNQEIATKRLKENNTLRDDEISKLKKRWQQEYEWMRDLNTPYIVRGVQVDDEHFINYLNGKHAWHPLPVIVMEYCNAGDLRAQLNKAESINGLTEHEVRAALHALRHAVEYLHTRCQIEHRDLKPDNVVIHEFGGKRHYKLTDFGFARNSPDNTLLKSVVGTRHYFAPEVVDTAHYTKTVDYWSLGVIAFELICGALPFVPHQHLYEIIINIKSKPRDCIAITEHPLEAKRFQFERQLFAENRITNIFQHKVEKWLRLALDVNYKTRGIELETAAAEPQANVINRAAFYNTLDAALHCKVLTIFCLNTYQFYAYEVTQSWSMLEFFAALETDTGISRQHMYFVFPSAHPRPALTRETRPIDIWVEQWQNGQEQAATVMLYVLGIQCDYNAGDPEISMLIKSCLQLHAAEDWLLQKFLQHTHFLLYDQQQRLATFLLGLKEFALTIENDILYFDTAIKTLLDEILLMRGGIKMFETMINAAYQVNRQQFPHSTAFFESWLVRAQTYIERMQKTDINVGQSLQKRYSSVLRRIKEQATSTLFDDLCKKDIYALDKFRQLSSARHKFKPKLETLQQFVFACIEQRHKFLSNSEMLSARSIIADVQQEFRKITQIVLDTRKYLTELQQQLNVETQEFHVRLLDLQLANGVNGNMAISCSTTQQFDNICTSFDKAITISSDELIAEANKHMSLMTMDLDDNCNELPAILSSN